MICAHQFPLQALVKARVLQKHFILPFPFSLLFIVSMDLSSFILPDLIELLLTFSPRNVLHRPQPGQHRGRSAGLLQLLLHIKTDLPSSSRLSGMKASPEKRLPEIAP